ncbi:MAG: acyltransferase [Ferruginibacter sp.]|nr:acyltransferase [Ferruginibacter sp.]
MLRRKLNQWISKRKGHHYCMDNNIPSGYLFWLALNKGMMLLRGWLSGIKNEGAFFLSAKAVIRAKSKLRLGHSVTIERDVYIDALSKDGIRLGNNVSVGRNTKIEATGNLQYLGKGLTTGNNVGLGKDCFYGCAGGILIKDDTIIGNYVSFHSENHGIDRPDILIRLQGVNHKGIIVGKNCWIGAKVTILDGAVIQDGCVIAAGAVVNAGIYQANGIYGGVPAKLIRYRNDLSAISKAVS